MTNIYKVVHSGNMASATVFRGSLSLCLKAVATYLGGFDGRQSITVKHAMESDYRIMKA